MTPGRIRRWIAGEAEDSDPGTIERCCVVGLWVAFFSAIMGLITLALEPTWRHLVTSLSDVGLILLIALCGAGWDRCKRLEAQRRELARKLDTTETILAGARAQNNALRGAPRRIYDR